MANILLVEDDTDLSETLQDWLAFQQHNVEAVYNGPEALEQMRFGSYDIVVLDWQLPGMNGIDVLKHYRDEGGALKVLMLTGRTEAKEIKALMEAGATDYMAKPFNLKDLSARIEKILSGATASA
ncbi:MAG: response regulator [Candidatus Obscuribacterales bacterium]|jgi:DNA-binding response OmpR family regulator|nr:response regulator [Candidatus Obscuribacterales bacterium]